MTSPVTQSVEVYDMDYFSGAAMLLYIGDVWVDEITSLQYRRQQTKSPIYGYASQLWDDVAAGQIIVHGEFSINFKEQGYLWAILRRFKNLNTDETIGSWTGTNRHDKNDKALLGDRSTDRRPVWGSNATKVNRASIERVVQGNVTKGDQYKFYQSLAGYATFDVNSPRDRAFENIVEEFEDQVWSKDVNNTVLNTQIRNPDDISFDGFDIFVTFGNYEVLPALAGLLPGSQANHTVQKIIDVRINSQSKVVKIDGEPVQEVYGFMARTTA